ncbi:MAG: hypothetical protein AAF938_26090 [Myxococcota bacterium]
MVHALLPYLAVPDGCATIDAMVAHLHPESWLAGASLQTIRAPFVERLLEHVHRLAEDRTRLLHLCRLADWLTSAERRRALDGLLAGRLPEIDVRHAPPISHGPAIDHLIHRLPAAWQEEWVSHRLAERGGTSLELFSEVQLRRRVGPFCEAVVRSLWARIDHDDRLIGSLYATLVEQLPADLRSAALARVRSFSDDSSRLRSLRAFDASELTERERVAVVSTPCNPEMRGHPSSQSKHLHSVRHLLRAVPMSLRRRWLECALAFESERDAQFALIALAPALDGESARRASAALQIAVVRSGGFLTAEEPWAMLSDSTVEEMLRRPLAERGLRHDELLRHVVSERPALAPAAVESVVARIQELDSNGCFELVAAVMPWIARHFPALPSQLASLAFERCSSDPNPLYWLDRA